MNSFPFKFNFIRKLSHIFIHMPKSTKSTKTVRFFDGSLVHFEASDASDVHIQVSEYVRANVGPNVWVELVSPHSAEQEQESEEEKGSDTYYDYCALIHPSRIVMILNRTQGNYISIDRENSTVKDTHVVKEMFGWEEDQSRFFPGHWATTDHIVFVPDHLHTYVSYAYAKLYL